MAEQFNGDWDKALMELTTPVCLRIKGFQRPVSLKFCEVADCSLVKYTGCSGSAVEDGNCSVREQDERLLAAARLVMNLPQAAQATFRIEEHKGLNHPAAGFGQFPELGL